MKEFYTQRNVGKAKYLVSFHDGVKSNKDGSDFYDVKIFKNKLDLTAFENHLRLQGYTNESFNK